MIQRDQLRETQVQEATQLLDCRQDIIVFKTRDRVI